MHRFATTAPGRSHRTEDGVVEVGDKISTCIYIAAILSDFLHQLNEELAENERRGLTSVLGFGAAPAVVVVDFTPRSPSRATRCRSRRISRPRSRLRRGWLPPRVPPASRSTTPQPYEEPDLADAGIWAKKVPASVTLRAGTPGVELDPRLGRREDEALVIKNTPRPSSKRPGESPDGAGVDTILLCGCTTSGCVRASAVDGLQHGFRVMVVQEAVGDRNPAAHRQSMLDMQAKYADIVARHDYRVSRRGLMPDTPFPYRPSIEAPAITWPGGASVAVWVAVNIEHYPIDRPGLSIVPVTAGNVRTR